MSLIGSSCKRVIVGLGKTGVSCARFLARQGLPFSVVDSRDNPPGIDVIRQNCPDAPLCLGQFSGEWLNHADELIVSPGVSLKEPAIAVALDQGVKAVGDIELFCRAIKDAPVIAITGSNGKSTVTTLVGKMAEASGLAVGVGGNIGTPVLDLLEREPCDLYVLELSSFQLETTYSLNAISTILNISPDHMDRYTTMEEYHQAKQRIYRQCKGAVYNSGDLLTTPLLPNHIPHCSFSAEVPDIGQYGLTTSDGQAWLAKGNKRLLSTHDLPVCGQHNYLDALAALALGDLAGLDLDAMLEVLRNFRGLPHRCQWIGEFGGIRWFNDSKATNVGAASAAINGLGEDIVGKLILIAGGDGKHADFSELKEPVGRYVRHVILMGRDGSMIERALENSVPICYAIDLEDAVGKAKQLAVMNDAVLLSPASASFDMFRSFEERGEIFAHHVHNMCVSGLRK
ncbi:UDP-N-acetylmuramoylalanine--D-glutamate ligase [invertebrate metagenome]|uniref:UDP-N-acetylmuramoylalanine--D-glutamate ligase n=1 Tax=invertebrate metagenome TaxID=1711999 RepID=A0A2H9TAU3_9ZZZZ